MGQFLRSSLWASVNPRVLELGGNHVAVHINSGLLQDSNTGLPSLCSHSSTDGLFLPRSLDEQY